MQVASIHAGKFQGMTEGMVWAEPVATSRLVGLTCHVYAGENTGICCIIHES